MVEVGDIYIRREPSCEPVRSKNIAIIVRIDILNDTVFYRKFCPNDARHLECNMDIHDFTGRYEKVNHA
jgi:hypothetical protein